MIFDRVTRKRPMTLGDFLQLQGSGDVTLRLVADTDNENESDHPGIYLSQDGGSTVSEIYIDSGNDLCLESDGHIWLLPGSERVRLWDGSSSYDFLHEGNVTDKLALKSPDGSYHRLIVDNAGQLTTTPL